ncbi:MAG: hypothetical protein ACREXX_22330 [Gammaproteobacteria bacterium]
MGPARTRDGRAILANDMHLPLGVRNVSSRAETEPGLFEIRLLWGPGG